MAVTLDQVLNDMSFFRDATKLDPTVRVLSLKLDGWVGTKGLMFRAEMQGKSAASYLTYIMFNGIDFTEIRDEEHDIPVTISGKLYYARIPDLRTNTIRLFCSCSDFRFRFSKELYDVGALIGNWRRYTPVAGSGRGPVNPQHRLGICKHCYSLLTNLNRMGYLKE